MIIMCGGCSKTCIIVDTKKMSFMLDIITKTSYIKDIERSVLIMFEYLKNNNPNDS